MIYKVLACVGGSPFIDKNGNKVYPICGGSEGKDNLLTVLADKIIIIDIITFLTIIFSILISIDTIKGIIRRERIGISKILLLVALVTASVLGIYLFIKISNINPVGDY